MEGKDGGECRVLKCDELISDVEEFNSVNSTDRFSK